MELLEAQVVELVVVGIKFNVAMVTVRHLGGLGLAGRPIDPPVFSAGFQPVGWHATFQVAVVAIEFEAGPATALTSGPDLMFPRFIDGLHAGREPLQRFDLVADWLIVLFHCIDPVVTLPPPRPWSTSKYGSGIWLSQHLVVVVGRKPSTQDNTTCYLTRTRARR